ncbi:MAG: hypothetical protein PHY09_14395, partial [Desulfuromonadaceae bacterium]|nr:hypothetical protein [Desulfuromonadaceae bacterium]
DGRINVTGELFREQNKTTPRVGFKVITAIVIAASLVTGGTTWYALKGKNSRTVSPTKVAEPKSATAPLQPLISSQPAVTPVISPVASAPVQQSTTAEDLSSRRAFRPPLKQKMVKPQQVSEEQASGTVPIPADIKLSGIAWQDERSARRAVVNGFLLKEGSGVSGATIVDIKADRVRFSSSAGVFEIKLDAVIPGEAPR